MSPMKEVLILLFIIYWLEESSFLTDWNYSSQYSLQTCPCKFECIHLGIVHSPHTTYSSHFTLTLLVTVAIFLGNWTCTKPGQTWVAGRLKSEREADMKVRSMKIRSTKYTHIQMVKQIPLRYRHLLLNLERIPFCNRLLVQWLSGVQPFATLWTAAHQASLSSTNSQSLLKLMSIKSVIPSKHFILCHPLLFRPSVFSSIRVFPKESVLHIRWPKY